MVGGAVGTLKSTGGTPVFYGLRRTIRGNAALPRRSFYDQIDGFDLDGTILFNRAVEPATEQAIARWPGGG